MRVRVLALCAFLVLLSSSIAYAEDLYFVRGTAKDRLGRLLEGVTVTNFYNGRSATTGSDGRYLLQEEPWTLRLYAWRDDLDTLVPGTILPHEPFLYEINFDLTYRLDVAITPSEFANTGDVILEIAATTKAPDPLCVSFQDHASGSIIALQKTSQTGNSSSWTGTYSVPTDRKSGIWNASVTGTDCETTRMTNLLDASYLITSPEREPSPTEEFYGPAIREVRSVKSLLVGDFLVEGPDPLSDNYYMVFAFKDTEESPVIVTVSAPSSTGILRRVYHQTWAASSLTIDSDLQKARLRGFVTGLGNVDIKLTNYWHTFQAWGSCASSGTEHDLVSKLGNVAVSSRVSYEGSIAGGTIISSICRAYASDVTAGAWYAF